MFQFACFPSYTLSFLHVWILKFDLERVSPFGLPRFIRLLDSSARLFAVLHVLLRLLMPRHPPLALSSFTYFQFELSLVLFVFWSRKIPFGILLSHWWFSLITYFFLRNLDNFLLCIIFPYSKICSQLRQSAVLKFLWAQAFLDFLCA